MSFSSRFGRHNEKEAGCFDLVGVAARALSVQVLGVGSRKECFESVVSVNTRNPPLNPPFNSVNHTLSTRSNAVNTLNVGSGVCLELVGVATRALSV